MFFGIKCKTILVKGKNNFLLLIDKWAVNQWKIEKKNLNKHLTSGAKQLNSAKSKLFRFQLKLNILWTEISLRNWRENFHFVFYKNFQIFWLNKWNNK
jgi:hypothetical protein